MSRRLVSRLAPASLALAALALSGCVSLLPKEKPAQLYELTPQVETAARTQPGKVVNVRLAVVDFEEASAGDRLLTVRDNEAAYIAGARWVSPARTLFEQDLQNAFAARNGAVRLLPRADAAPSVATLAVSVETFRVQYEDGAPTVQTVLRARLIRSADRTIVLDRRISFSSKADANRVSAIVKAYDTALGAALTDLVETVDAAART